MLCGPMFFPSVMESNEACSIWICYKCEIRQEMLNAPRRWVVLPSFVVSEVTNATFQCWTEIGAKYIKTCWAEQPNLVNWLLLNPMFITVQVWHKPVKPSTRQMFLTYCSKASQFQNGRKYGAKFKMLGFTYIHLVIFGLKQQLPASRNHVAIFETPSSHGFGFPNYRSQCMLNSLFENPLNSNGSWIYSYSYSKIVSH